MTKQEQQTGGALLALLIALGLIIANNQPKPTPPPPSSTTTTTATTATTATPVAPSSTNGTVVASTLTPSGVDDTARFIAAVRAGNVVVDGPLVINDVAKLDEITDRTITFTGKGSLTRTTRNAKRVWQVLALRNAQRITINNLRIVGPNVEVCNWLYTPPKPTGPNDATSQTPYMIRVGYNPKFEAQHGLEVFGGSGIVVNGANIYGVSGDGVYLAGGAANVMLNDVTTKCTGRSSISNVGSTNVVVNRGNFSESGYWILNVEPDLTASVDRYVVNRPVIGFSNFSWLFSSGPNFSCKVTNSAVNQPQLSTPQRVTINGCVRSGLVVRP